MMMMVVMMVVMAIVMSTAIVVMMSGGYALGYSFTAADKPWEYGRFYGARDPAELLRLCHADLFTIWRNHVLHSIPRPNSNTDDPHLTLTIFLNFSKGQMV